MLNHDKSKALFARAKTLIPGGVNSPVRAFRAVGGEPPFIARGEGAYLVDVDENRYVDYVMSWGPLLFGHAPPSVIAAIVEAAALGTSFGAPTEREVRFAEAIRARVPSVERLRLTSSGTEACMAAIRLMRGATGRDGIVKFEGCYHGHADSLLVKAGSGVATLGLPDSPGVPADLAKHTFTVPFNDEAALRQLFAERGSEIAGCIVEPVVGNMGVLLPRPGYLEAMLSISHAAGALVIFDEVMTGFRLSAGGAQTRYGLTPDLSTFGKVIGGGLPVGAYGGRADLMKLIAPEGPVYQAGTLSGNPLAVAAGLAALELATPQAYAALEETTKALCDGLTARARSAGVPLQVNRAGSMWTAFFSTEDVTDAASASRSDKARFAKFHAAMLDRGVYLPPSQFEAAFVSTAHGEREVALTLEAASEALRA